MEDDFLRIGCDYYNKRYIKHIKCKGQECEMTIANTEIKSDLYPLANILTNYDEKVKFNKKNAMYCPDGGVLFQKV